MKKDGWMDGWMDGLAKGWDCGRGDGVVVGWLGGLMLYTYGEVGGRVPDLMGVGCGRRGT